MRTRAQRTSMRDLRCVQTAAETVPSMFTPYQEAIICCHRMIYLTIIPLQAKALGRSLGVTDSLPAARRLYDQYLCGAMVLRPSLRVRWRTRQRPRSIFRPWVGRPTRLTWITTPP